MAQAPEEESDVSVDEERRKQARECKPRPIQAYNTYVREQQNSKLQPRAHGLSPVSALCPLRKRAGAHRDRYTPPSPFTNPEEPLDSPSQPRRVVPVRKLQAYRRNSGGCRRFRRWRGPSQTRPGHPGTRRGRRCGYPPVLAGRQRGELFGRSAGVDVHAAGGGDRAWPGPMCACFVENYAQTTLSSSRVLRCKKNVHRTR